MVPERSTPHVDIRFTPGCFQDEITGELGALLQSDSDIRSGRVLPVSPTTETHIGRSSLAAMPGAEPAGSPLAHDWVHLHDLPVGKIGPGPSELSHTADEHATFARSRARLPSTSASFRHHSICVLDSELLMYRQRQSRRRSSAMVGNPAGHTRPPRCKPGWQGNNRSSNLLLTAVF